MSYWIYLTDVDGDTLAVDRHSEGGTFAIGGVPEAELNVTYNYSAQYGKHDFSLRDLHGKSAAETVSRLRELVGILGTDQDNDYWASTPGNAGYALSILVGWADRHPEGVWRVS